jgi:hypothetical protein
VIKRFFRFTAVCLMFTLIAGATGVAPARTSELPIVVDEQDATQTDIVLAAAAPVVEPVVEAVIEDPGLLPVRQPYAANKDNPFSGHSWYTPPPATPARKSTPSGPRKARAPALPYKLLGTYQQQGSSTLYFLVQGDRVFDVVTGDTLDDTYRVDGEKNGQLMFTYLPLNTSQGLRLGD